MAQTDDDLRTVPLRERTPGEREAYLQGYRAAIDGMNRHMKALTAAANVAEEVNLGALCPSRRERRASEEVPS